MVITPPVGVELAGEVAMAQWATQEARLAFGLCHVDSISENRRVKGGTIDPAVPVVRFDDRGGDWDAQ